MNKGKFVYYNNAIVHIDVRDSFILLRNTLTNTLGLPIDIVDSIKSEYEIVNELILRYKYKKELPVQAVESESDASYELIKSLIENSPMDKFDPPLGLPVFSNRQPYDSLYTIPHLPQYDPRRSGRIIKIGPKAAINQTVLGFMVQNAGNFGFLHYGPYDPTIWYWRGDIEPYTYKPQEVVSYLTSELSYLL